MTTTIPKAPAGLQDAGRRLWRSLHAKWTFDERETPLVAAACRIQDRLVVLGHLVDEEGPVVLSPQGSKVNPALTEERQQALTLGRLLGQLEVPSEAVSANRARQASPRWRGEGARRGA